MATKAKYYVEQKDANGRWWLVAQTSGRRHAWAEIGYASVIYGRKRSRRIRHKGRVIARWKDGRRMPQERGQ